MSNLKSTIELIFNTRKKNAVTTPYRLREMNKLKAISDAKWLITTNNSDQRRPRQQRRRQNQK